MTNPEPSPTPVEGARRCSECGAWVEIEKEMSEIHRFTSGHPLRLAPTPTPAEATEEEQEARDAIFAAANRNVLANRVAVSLTPLLDAYRDAIEKRVREEQEDKR